MEPIIKNAANEEQQEGAKLKVRINTDKERNRILALMKMREFRDFIRPFIERCDLSSADNSGSWTYFREGERNICQKIKSQLIEADAESVLLMFKEGRETK